MAPADPAGRAWLGFLAFVYGVGSIAVLSALALATDAPFVFPSLGPTAFLVFSTPLAPAASPRNALFGHLIGAASGYLALVVFRLTGDAPALVEGIGWTRVGAAALSLGLTSGLMVWLRVPHPPAGATTLIVSLGVLQEPWELAVLMLAVALLVVQGFVVNRAAKVPYPLWAPAPAAGEADASRT